MFNLVSISLELTTVLKTIAIIICVVILIYAFAGTAFFIVALGRKKRKDPTKPANGSIFDKNKDHPVMKAGYKWFDNTYHQEVSITSSNGKNLHAVEFRNPSNSDVWVIQIHGWTNMTREMSAYAKGYYERGYNVLIPELRGHQNSESKYITMGWCDRLDIVDWINSIVEELPKSKIILSGVSMGGATVMMATGEKLPENVKLAIEDCGYTSVKDIFVDQSFRAYHAPAFLTIPPASLMCKILNGFFFKEGSCITQLKKSVTPTLFIHGDKDNFVLPPSVDLVYDACTAEKEKHIIKGAVHALSVHYFPEEYWSVIDRFIEKHLNAVKG